MDIGDLAQYQGKRWIVASHDRPSRTCTLFSQSGEEVELAREHDKTHPKELQVVASPGKQWPMLIAPVHPGAGPFERLTIPALPGRRDRVLEAWVDWVPSDPTREGGSFFVRPEVRLLPGILLLATHRSGLVVRVVVPKTVGTVAQRKARAQAKVPPKPDPGRLGRILRDDDDDF